MFREGLLLVKHGVPFDVAFTMTDEMRLAACVVFGEFEGNQFSWRDMKWMERK